MRWASITGSETVRAALERRAAAAPRALARALRDAARRVAATMRAEAPAASGLLRRAIGPGPLRTYPGTVFIAVGVRRGFRRRVSATRAGRLVVRRRATDEGAWQNPTKYLHLVTGGRKAVQARGKRLFDPRTGRFFGREVRPARPNPFVARAAAQLGGVAAGVVEDAARRLVVEHG